MHTAQIHRFNQIAIIISMIFSTEPEITLKICICMEPINSQSDLDQKEIKRKALTT